REAARRMQCASQIRQLGLAVQNYESAQGTLPVSTSPFWEGPRPGPETSGKGWIALTLPHFEQGALADGLTVYAGGNFFAGAGLKSLACRPLVQTHISLL